MQKLTLDRYPGKLAALVLFGGCSFRCPWCYAPELVVPEKIRKTPSFSEEEILRFLKEKRKQLEGVVFSGGEPTIYEDLPRFCEKVKRMGYAVKLETNGSNPTLLRKLARKNLVDYFALDVKAPPARYLEVIGLSNFFSYFDGDHEGFFGRAILYHVEDSIDFLKNGGVDFEFKTTLVPGLIGREDVLKIAEWVSPAPRFVLQKYRKGKSVNPDFKTPDYENEYFLKILKAIEPFFEECELRPA